MNLLLALLTVMTFTVETKNSVSMNGQCPYDIEVAYECSYQKGQVRAGDVATLSLSNLGGMVIEQIEVYVKSNKSAGEGTFTVQANGSTASSKSGSLWLFVGTFDNQNYHAISLLDNSIANVHNLSIKLSGTVSSLYIEKYVISYGTAPARTVTLMNGDEVYGTVKEEAGGQGVTLPGLPGLTQWQFIGWTETPFETDYTAVTSLYRSGMKYYPIEDATLWAVYEYQPTPRVYSTELTYGDYLYLNIETNAAMSGLPENGTMTVSPANIQDANQKYTIEFNTRADSATIRYTTTGAYIAYSGAKLMQKPTACWWAVFHDAHRTAFYTTINNKIYVLFPGKIMKDMNTLCTALIDATDVSLSPTALLSAEPMTEEPWYSCFPAKLQDVDSPLAERKEVVVPFGIYELHIQDGHKKLRLR